MKKQDMKAAIREFLSRSLRGHTLNDDDDIFSLGLVHSLFTVQIILFIEKNFQVELEVSELKTEQIATVNKIVELIQRQTGSKLCALKIMSWLSKRQSCLPNNISPRLHRILNVSSLLCQTLFLAWRRPGT